MLYKKKEEKAINLDNITKDLLRYCRGGAITTETDGIKDRVLLDKTIGRESMKCNVSRKQIIVQAGLHN